MTARHQVGETRSASWLREPLPIGSDLPEWAGRSFFLSVLVLGWVSGLIAGEPDPHASSCITLKGGRSARRPLDTVFDHVVNDGVSAWFAAHALADLHHSIEPSLAAGKSTTLCLALVEHAIESAHAAGWSASDLSRLLIRLQGQVDSGSRLPLADLHEVVKEIQPGVGVEQVLARLDEWATPPGREKD